LLSVNNGAWIIVPQYLFYPIYAAESRRSCKLLLALMLKFMVKNIDIDLTKDYDKSG